ncbi:cryptochrome/deoxyribodipyrimidine photo-lyase family protein [Synechococcus sp. CCY 9618]|uniref:cryptochrome/deoxyribodipyrimidine photo-lyase family protein n=1 Tax=Synechococcus sp. CCY 9618 TaxID=2815602 RepID=UPI001C2430F7|nr:cryptochrome/deoxyribodipyrimidine photo-lyase family protein [Synechococcus sp. CCY 9618]
MALQVVWFKRDLRSHDHRPLLEARRRGPVLPLFVAEPELWRQPDASSRQWSFCREGLEELRTALADLGQPLVVRVGDVVAVLEAAHRGHGIAGLWSHQETGNLWTFERDRRVAAWARERGIPWRETAPFGVIRGLKDRRGWARAWERRMADPLPGAPEGLPPLDGIRPGALPAAGELGLTEDPCPGRQRGGRARGLDLLEGFLHQRGRAYHLRLSSPLTAFEACSRLSPHLAWGTISMAEVVQATRARRQDLMGLPAAAAAGWPRALDAFLSRLHWHCHFIQKLESQPSIENLELHPATRGLRCTDPERLAAWSTGHTGVPFVDACMRALRASGWINFRMRAMLMSFASHHLWIDWRDSGLHLARQFVDYEPGIHWSQCQMQSGTTGINTIRIYNPLKQGLDHDPDGLFLTRWLPELARVPAAWRHEPWRMDGATQAACGCRIGSDYPAPIVDLAVAARQARERLWALRRQDGFAATAAAIQERHGSRRSGLPPTGRRRSSGRRRGDDGQLSLDLNLGLGHGAGSSPQPGA